MQNLGLHSVQHKSNKTFASSTQAQNQAVILWLLYKDFCSEKQY